MPHGEAVPESRSADMPPLVRSYHEKLYQELMELVRTLGCERLADVEAQYHTNTPEGLLVIANNPTLSTRFLRLHHLTTLLEAIRRNPQDTSLLPPDYPLLAAFDCEPHEIARSIAEITPRTKAYVGPLEPGIFTLLPATVEHIYTAFPEGRIRRERIEIGGKTKKELQDLLEQGGFRTSDYARSMMQRKDFTTLRNPEAITLIRLSVADLGFPEGATTQEIFDRAIALGLELCPAEVGPQYRLQYKNQPMNEWVYVGMKQIAGSDGCPFVFGVARDDDGSWLFSRWAEPADEWGAGHEFVFRLRKPAHRSSTAKVGKPLLL